MRRDPTEFRKRFAAWKDGKKPYEAGLPVYKGGKTPHEEFVEQMGPVLYKELLRTNTPNIDTAYDHMLRLLAYESDYGRSRVARLLHNYGGYGWNGKTYTTFKDDEDFIRHYVLLMNNRYGAAVNADSVQAYGKALKDKGYYEDTLANYTRNLVGMRSLSRSAAAHRLSNPNLYQIKPLALTPAAEQLESAPQFQPVNIVVPEVNTDYSLQNASMQSPAPQAINAWKGKGSPAYGGYSLRMPSIEEYMMPKNIMPRGFKDGKLPGYKDGTRKVIQNNYTNAKFNDDGIFTDDTTKIFDDLIITPKGVTTKYGSYTDKNWDRYKQLENYFKYHDQQTGKVKAEPGLEIVSPEYDLISGIRGILQMLSYKGKPVSRTITYNDAKKLSDDLWDALYKAAIKRKDGKEIQNIRDLHFAIKSPNNKAVDVDGKPVLQYHTVGDEYSPEFTKFNPDIEGLNSSIYTTDNRFMSGTYSSNILSEEERDHIINSTRIMLLSDLNRHNKPFPNYIEKLIKIYSDPKKARLQILKDHPWVGGPVDPNRQKQLYSYLTDPVIIDARGRDWAHIPLSELPEDVFKNIHVDPRGGIADWYSTRSIENAIRELNYDGAIIKNVLDYGGRKKYFGPEIMNNPGTVFQIKNPKMIKLSDAITYDDAGQIIPLSKRDNFNVADLRYGIVPLSLFGTGYGLYNK